MTEPRTILIADRHTHVVNAVKARLQSAGFLVATASDGAEAYALAIGLRPDAIITDYQVPRLSGPELCVRLARDPLTCDIPVILLTATGLDASTIPADNIVRVLEKPLRPQLLLETVQELLAESLAV
jgi:two-component system phosphate regulon response regulator PhoB